MYVLLAPYCSVVGDSETGQASHSGDSGSLSLSLSFCPIPQCLSKFSLPMPDALPQGLIRELPSADGYNKTAPVEEPSPDMDDLDELKKLLEALNAA